MTSRPVHAAALTCHPDTPSAALRGVATRVSRQPRGVLTVTWILDGDLDRLRVPAPRPPRVANRLWEHTCCELFIARKGRPGYHEFNLSPSGEWAAYAFERYRAAAPLADETAAATLAPQVAVRRTEETLELAAEIRLDRLSPVHAAAALAIALSLVAEGEDGALSYWALRHPPGKPDFHHADAFVLELAGAQS